MQNRNYLNVSLKDIKLLVTTSSNKNKTNKRTKKHKTTTTKKLESKNLGDANYTVVLYNIDINN